jgi:hypothetical protein
VNLATVEMKAFVPAHDFAQSKAFYTRLGFNVPWSSDDLAYVHYGNTSFLLQAFHVPEHTNNFMMHLLVENVDDWHAYVLASGAVEAFAALRLRARSLRSAFGPSRAKRAMFASPSMAPQSNDASLRRRQFSSSPWPITKTGHKGPRGKSGHGVLGHGWRLCGRSGVAGRPMSALARNPVMRRSWMIAR